MKNKKSNKYHRYSRISGLVMMAMIVLSVLAVGNVLAASAGPPSTKGVQPVYYPGNPQGGPNNDNVGYFDPSYQEFRVSDLDSSGTYSDGYLTLDITVYNDDPGPRFDWEIAESSNIKALPGIFVKGGPGGNWYDYTDFEDVNGVIGADWDGYLHSPLNPSNNKFYGLSHVSFAYVFPPDAYITIEADATNEVGNPHTFTVTVWEDPTSDGTGNFVPAAGETVVVSFESLYGADTIADATLETDANGQATVTINSDNAGQIVATASSDVDVDGTTISRTTDGSETPNGGENSDPATKTYVDAYITITPDDWNLVGVIHYFTVTVWENAGMGHGFVAAADELVYISYEELNGADPQTDTSDTTDGSGMVMFGVNSFATGQIVATASSYVQVGGLSLYRSTDGIGSNSGPATKTYVDAKISIEEDADNAVGNEHTFTITLMFDLGDGAGFEGAEGQTVTASISGVGYFVGGVDSDVTEEDGTATVTINSDDPGQSTVTATWEGEIVEGYAGSYLLISTDGTRSNSYPAVKTWWVGRITLTPETATNEINEPHEITAHLEYSVDGVTWMDVSGALVTFSLNDGDAYFVGDSFATTDADGTCSVWINKPTGGTVIISAQSDFTIDGIDGTFSVATGTGYSGPDAEKIYVDAFIEIAYDDWNLIGLDHVFTVTVWENDGSGFAHAEGASVTVSFTSLWGAAVIEPVTGTTNSHGEFAVTVNSPTTGQIVATASATVIVGGLTLDRSTDGISPNSGPATKTYVNARISITGDDENVVGLQHTFTVLLEFDLGDGAGFVGASGQTVTASISGVGYFVGGNSAITDDNGYASITINSDEPGTSTVTASFAGEIVSGYADTLISISTDGNNGNSAPAVKTWWVGRITLTPATATNGITEPHEITAHMERTNDGVTWTDVSGALVTFSLTDGDGDAYFVGGVNTGTTGADGTTSVWINKPTAGTVYMDASSTFTIVGIDGTFSVSTGTGYSGQAAEKTYVDASLFWLKHNHMDQLLGGATFEVTRTHDRFGNDIPDEITTVTDNEYPDMDTDDGEFLLIGLPFGTYTIRETQAPEGYFLETHVETVLVTDLFNPDVVVGYIWINTPGRSQLTPTGIEPDEFYQGTAPDLVLTVGNGGRVNPGRFFYYNLFKASGDTTIVITTRTNPDEEPDAVADRAWLYIINPDTNLTERVDNKPGVTISIENNVVTFFIPDEYVQQSLDGIVLSRVGYKPPKVPAGTTLIFETFVNGFFALDEEITVIEA